MDLLPCLREQNKVTNSARYKKEVIVDDERLATALSRLSELRRKVLSLYYFVGYCDEAIGRLLLSSIYYGDCYTVEVILSLIYATLRALK